LTLSFLAEAISGRASTRSGRLPAVQAVKSEPAVTYHRMALARVLWNARQPDESIRVAQSALQTADTDEEKKEVQGFLDFAARRP
jgi:hypothetical protein